MDTIFALASARGKAGVSVIRISGERAFEAAAALCGTLPEPRLAGVRPLKFQGSLLDQALVLAFEEGASFTGERSVELQIHGGAATISAVLAALSRQPGLRLAEAGEFSRRALENGRLDLTQIEGLADLIDAETEAQRRQAVAVLSGALGRKAEDWRRDLVRSQSLLEATIDFSEEDVPEVVTEEVSQALGRVRDAIAAELAGAGAAERIREGFEVAIVGAPNVGKSTLLNALAGREAAITSEIAGTTRDVIEVRMEIAGLPVTLLDTAGLRDTQDQIELRGIERALVRARQADLRVFLVADDEELPLVPEERDLVFLAKADMREMRAGAVSGLTGEGLDELIARIAAALEVLSARPSLVIRERQRHGLERALANLSSALSLVEVMGAAELTAEEIRGATRALEILIGRVGVEDLLDEIFSRFCIGK
ncbi:tRNA uridine-5-carboxymethylaminomethyl(34) synthesis GTPase MnmE [Tabrizicola oligotrophica]|uniref:tRNA modification GTPase MnmE n=1 Tax=Tabrizicola oligotrophica TaxID=2710650 RepID=A0A6M0QSA2_9RHOB|nr:tRNA uridine-5-carboxymethylaminomethyl(34) synthesis GTPase MnmE [Tabrizicola oligotrophica]NEY90306.1 tRNA uridine-5-carboxymethylaminomethyl(34) synthesis GTPase MnmE [Tabrizicola oligotrophica]